jgi:hypothetical protein
MIVTTGRVDITTQRIDLATQDIHSSVKVGFLQVTELQSQLAENFAKMMEAQKAEATVGSRIPVKLCMLTLSEKSCISSARRN